MMKAARKTLVVVLVAYAAYVALAYVAALLPGFPSPPGISALLPSNVLKKLGIPPPSTSDEALGAAKEALEGLPRPPIEPPVPGKDPFPDPRNPPKPHRPPKPPSPKDVVDGIL